jgi:hypothetical protein
MANPLSLPEAASTLLLPYGLGVWCQGYSKRAQPTPSTALAAGFCTDEKRKHVYINAHIGTTWLILTDFL